MQLQTFHKLRIHTWSSIQLPFTDRWDASDTVVCIDIPVLHLYFLFRNCTIQIAGVTIFLIKVKSVIEGFQSLFYHQTSASCGAHDTFIVLCMCVYSCIYLHYDRDVCCLVVSASPGCCSPPFPLYPLSWNPSCQQGQSTLFLHHSRPSSLTDAWHSLPSQTGPLVRVRLLRGHVHQWCEGGQARRGEDGRSRPGCIVGPGAICIHRYTDTLIAFFL